MALALNKSHAILAENLALADYLRREELVHIEVPVPRPSLPFILAYRYSEGDSYLSPASANVTANAMRQSRCLLDDDSMVDYLLVEGLVPADVPVRRASLPRILAYLKDTSLHDPLLNCAAGRCFPVVETEGPATTFAGTEPLTNVLTSSKTESHIRSIRPRSARRKVPLCSAVVSTHELEPKPTLCPGESIDPIVISDDDDCVPIARDDQVLACSSSHSSQSPGRFLQSSSQPSAQSADNLACTVAGFNTFPTGGDKYPVRTPFIVEPISPPESSAQLDPDSSKRHRCEYDGCDQVFDDPLQLSVHECLVHILPTLVVQKIEPPRLVQSSSQPSAQNADNSSCTVDGFNSLPAGDHKNSVRMPLISGPISSASQTSSAGVTESRGNAIAAKKRRRKTHDCEYDGCRKTYARKDQLEAHVHRDHLLGPPQTNVTANDNFKSKVTGRRPTQHRNKSPRSRRRIILSKPSDAVPAGDSHRRYDTSPRHTSNAVLSASPTSTLHKKVRKRLPLIYECEYAGCGRTFCKKVRLVRHVERNHLSRSQPRSYAEICKLVESSSDYVDVAENSTCIIDDFSDISASLNSTLTNGDPFLGVSIPIMPISPMPNATESYRGEYECKYEGCSNVYDKRCQLKVHVQRIHSMHLPSDGCTSFAPVPFSARSTQLVDLDVDLGVDLSVPPIDTGLLVEDSQCGARPASDTLMSILSASSSSSATAVESPRSLHALEKTRPATYHYCPHHGCSEVYINKFMLAAHIKRSHSQSRRTTQENQPYSNALRAENLADESADADDMRRAFVSHTDYLISHNEFLLGACHLAGSAGDLSNKLYPDSNKNKGRGKAQTSRKQLVQYVEGPHLKRRRRKFRCQGCDRVYRKKSALATHARCHTDGRPYMCSEPGCNERFYTTDQRSRHEKGHSGERPHQCQLCGDGFKRSDHLAKHKMCVHRDN